MKEGQQDWWSGRVGFMLATIGSAVGLGSIWKFPYEVGSNGGGVFLFFYAIGLIAIVTPLMVAEFAIGRRGRGDPATSIRAVAAAYGASPWWAGIGVLGVLTGFLILSFYCVIGGWTMGYAVTTALTGLPGTDPATVRAQFEAFLASPLRLLAYDALFIAATVLIVARGIRRGIEAAVTLLMPLLALLMVGLAVYAALAGDLGTTLRFLFTLEWQQVSARAALDALGLGFFSIGVGIGLMITYAAYGGLAINLKQVAIVSVVADTGISLLAGLAVFPIVFARGLDAAEGPGLVFVTLPLAFAAMPFGALAASAFLLLLVVAALASAVSLLELVVALLVHRLAWPRVVASVAAGTACLVAGIPTVLSFNAWATWFPLAFIDLFARATVFDLVDHLTSNLLLPAGGLGLAIFAGWALPERLLVEELRLSPAGATVLRLTLRYVAPIGIVIAACAPLVV
jgi:NSS family neurotransmitter:Na+ symporter